MTCSPSNHGRNLTPAQQQFGNKNALGNNGGRPRTVTPPPEEMIALGEEMIAWVKENNPLHLSCWYSGEKFITDKVWDTMQVAPEFFPYYEHALKLVGKQYLDKNSNVRDGISQRWQRVYFKDLRKSEDLDFKEEYDRKKDLIEHQAKVAQETGLQVDINITEAFEATKAQLKRIRSSKSDLKIDDNSMSNDKKS